MIVEASCSGLCTGTQLLLPILPVTDPVDVHTRDQDAPRSVQALDARLSPYGVSNQRHVNPRKLAQACELTRGFEDLLVEVPHAKLLGQAIRIALVALGPSALRDPGHHDLVHVRTQRLVQPGALKALFEHQVLAPWNHPYRLNQGLAVGLDREVLQPLPGL